MHLSPVDCFTRSSFFFFSLPFPAPKNSSSFSIKGIWRGERSGWWRAFDKSWSLAWSSCVFWEWLSRVPCKEDVAEKQCFLPDKSKASLRQDVWALAAPRIKRAHGKGKGTCCSF